MASYYPRLAGIEPPKCDTCSLPAAVTLMIGPAAKAGAFCRMCGEERLRSAQRTVPVPWKSPVGERT